MKLCGLASRRTPASLREREVLRRASRTPAGAQSASSSPHVAAAVLTVLTTVLRPSQVVVTRIHRRCTVALADAPWFEGSDAGFRRRSWSHWLPVVEPRARAWQ